MRPDGPAAARGAWTEGADSGALATWTFRGAQGLARLSGPGAWSARSPHAFAARLDRMRLDHVALEAFACTPCRYERDLARIARHPAELLSIVLLVEGGIAAQGPNGPFALAAGQHVVVDGRTPLRWSSASDSRLLAVVLGREHVPPYLRSSEAILARPLPRTALSDSCFAFVSSLLRSEGMSRGVQPDRLLAAVTDLQAAVLGEAQGIVGRPVGPAGLRWRMEEHIEAHLADPDLDPAAVAEAVGIGLRQAHAVFNDGGRTIARFITDRRIAAVALELRQVGGGPHRGALHTRYGFASADVLTRNFRARFHMSPREYRAAGHRGLD